MSATNQTNNENTHQNTVTFYAWLPNGRGFGHLATECALSDKKIHHSLWPQSGASLWSAISTWMHQGRVVTSMEHDMFLEEGKKPTYIIKFNVDDETAQKVANWMNQSRNEVESGKKSYCLTPNTPLLKSFIKFMLKPNLPFSTDPDIAREHISAPTDLDQETGWNFIRELKTSHCSEEAVEIAKLIGVPVEHKPFAPWNHTPGSLTDTLMRQPNALVEKVVQENPPHRPGDLNPDFVAP